MFTSLTQWIARRPTAGGAYAGAFVTGVEVEEPRAPRDPRLVRFLAVCWGLIVVKHVAVLWAASHYHLPFNPLIVNFPTWLLGTLATTLYFRGTR